MTLPPKLVLFDLDGTLVDSQRDLAAAANALIARYDGTQLDEATIGAMIGEGAAVLVRRALTAALQEVDGSAMTEVGEQQFHEFDRLYADRILDTTCPYAGIRELLERLYPILPLAVLTNKPARPARQILDGLDLSRYFQAVVTGDDGARKPDPANLLRLANTAGYEAAQTLLVGDSFIDFNTARRAGAGIAMARYGFGYENFPAEHLQGDELLLDAPLELASALDV